MALRTFGTAGRGELSVHGQLNRRRLLQLGGLSLAGLAATSCAPPRERVQATGSASGELGGELTLVTWPNYHDPESFKAFEKATGVKVNVKVLGSNEEMLAKLQVGSTGWDVFVPTNYTIETYADLDVIEPLSLDRLTNYAPETYEARFLKASAVKGDDSTYAIPKNWGTTGYAYWTDKVAEELTSWKQFWDLTASTYSGKTTIHDYQLTSIGNALAYYGYSINSIDPAELAKAEELLIETKPHLFAITSDYQPPLRAKDAFLAMAWTGDALQVNREEPNVKFVLGSEGGEIWEDNWAIVKDAPNKDAAYAFLNFMIDPEVAKKESLFHGYPQVDKRATELLPADMLENPIVYPAPELLAPLEFGAAQTLTDPGRAELWARVKSA